MRPEAAGRLAWDPSQRREDAITRSATMKAQEGIVVGESGASGAPATSAAVKGSDSGTCSTRL